MEFFSPPWDSTHFLNVPESHRRWRRSFTHMSKVSGPVRVAATGRSEACAGSRFYCCFPPFPLPAQVNESAQAGKRLLALLVNAYLKQPDAEEVTAATVTHHWLPVTVFVKGKEHVPLLALIKGVAKFGSGAHTFPLSDPEVIKAMTAAVKDSPIGGSRGSSGQGVFYYRSNDDDDDDDDTDGTAPTQQVQRLEAGFQGGAVHLRRVSQSRSAIRRRCHRRPVRSHRRRRTSPWARQEGRQVGVGVHHQDDAQVGTCFVHTSSSSSEGQ